MKICVLTTSWPRFAGDLAGNFLLPLYAGLAGEHGHEITVLAPHHPQAPRAERVEGLEVRRFPYFLPTGRQCLCYGTGIPDNLRSKPLAKFQLPGFMLAMLAGSIGQAARCDVIHANWIEPGLMAIAARLLIRRPVVVSVHNFNPPPSARRLYAWVPRKADHVFYNSSYTRDRARQGGAGSNGQILPLGVDTHRFSPQGPDIRASMGIPPRALVVGALGRMIELKGHRYLLEAFSKLERSERDLHLVIGGDGVLRPNLEQQARQLGLGDRVHWPGMVDTSDVPAFIRSCDVFCLPSIVDSQGRTEGLGMVIPEAMACGVPCIGSRAGGIVDSIVHEETGLLVEPADPDALRGAIERLGADEALRARLVQGGHRRVSDHFSWPAICRQVDSVYRTLAPGR
ncbi:MAG: glycosyltransferase family 4 protein [Phycisphaerae bacterium]